MEGREQVDKDPPSLPRKWENWETEPPPHTLILVSRSARGKNGTQYFMTVFLPVNGIDDSLVAHNFALKTFF